MEFPVGNPMFPVVSAWFHVWQPVVSLHFLSGIWAVSAFHVVEITRKLGVAGMETRFPRGFLSGNLCFQWFPGGFLSGNQGFQWFPIW